MEKIKDKIGEVSKEEVSKKISKKWQARFAFYDQYGLPGFWKTPPLYASAYKALTLWQRMNIGFNIWAFVFSFIYLFCVGLWKKAIIVLLLFLVINVISIAYDITFLGYAVCGFTGFKANTWFYLLKVKKEQTWGL
ncbi:TPA: DUF2628 domain-containing protein [Citrobacter farmeri]